MRKLITVHLQALLIQIPIRIVHGLHSRFQFSVFSSQYINFNYLNNSQFSCFLSSYTTLLKIPIHPSSQCNLFLSTKVTSFLYGGLVSHAARISLCQRSFRIHASSRSFEASPKTHRCQNILYRTAAHVL